MLIMRGYFHWGSLACARISEKNIAINRRCCGTWIRPIRHIVRGAFLESTGNRFQFDVGWVCTPLYDDREHQFDYVLRGKFNVWQPHFEPLLMSCLAEDIFDKIGGVRIQHLGYNA